MSPNEKVVTRFAPSPTGFMHVGGVRTAIYAWAFARKHRGTFILRIEDTDKAREVAGSIAHIQESLRWLGIDWDQGPFLQSDRLARYREHAEALIEKGFAYPDPYSEEEVEALRRKAEEEKRPFLYRDHRPETTEKWDGTKPLRFRVPEIKRYEWEDMTRGTLSAGEEALDDFILIKSDGYPTYNFAHIVDDLEMGVTHIIRGEEFISSTPKFLSLYGALGITPPRLATVPVILGPDGKKKLSKRDGAKDILEYRAEGYLPEAMVNFLALLGWHPGEGEEYMDQATLIETFDLERVQKGGARFDEAKLKWLNREHLSRLSGEEFASRLKAFAGAEVALPLAELIKERAQTLLEARELLAEYDFSHAEPSRELLLQGAGAEAQAVHAHLTRVHALISALADEPFTVDAVKEAVFPYATDAGRGQVLWPLRVALSGMERSPDPFALAALLGKKESLLRIEKALNVLK